MLDPGLGHPERAHRPDPCGSAPAAPARLHWHEFAEALTDPDIGLDNQSNYAYPAAWADNSASCQYGGEIADIWSATGAGVIITVSARSWMVQQLWSNKQNKCATAGTPLPACSGTVSSTCRECSCGRKRRAP